MLVSDAVQVLTPISLSGIVCLSKLQFFFCPTNIRNTVQEQPVMLFTSASVCCM